MGLESIDDLINDLDQALQNACKVVIAITSNAVIHIVCMCCAKVSLRLRSTGSWKPFCGPQKLCSDSIKTTRYVIID